MLPWGQVPLILIAQEGGTLGGASGWAGAGLLGGVLLWLLFTHLPAKDRQLKEFMENKDKAMAELTRANDQRVVELSTAFILATREIRADGKDALDKVIVHCERDSALVAKSVDRLTVMVEHLANGK